MGSARVVDDDAASCELCSRPTPHGLDLGADLTRQPFVVVIAEGDEIGVQYEDSGVPSAGESRRPVVNGHSHAVAIGQPRVRLGAVINDQCPQWTRVILGKYRGEGSAQRTWPVMGRHHHAYGRPRGHCLAPTYP